SLLTTHDHIAERKVLGRKYQRAQNTSTTMFSSIRKSSKDQKDEIAISNGTQISLSDYKTVTLHRYKNEPLALKILHNSTEFLPLVIFLAAPGVDNLKFLYDYGRSHNHNHNGYSSRNLTFDRTSSIRYSSRRARTMESLASLYEEEDIKRTLEESACLQRSYERFIDKVIVNEDFDETFRTVVELLDTLSNKHQWVPVNWVY
ncbi:uncharacterized protein LOC103521581, partial [Diaphorina citri]|uniref:Uncharacterized protein LOC103521581 n=1 Tax=Diaphorina citri TaxID=121845 RepID=A0A1S3DMN6_DIACI